MEVTRKELAELFDVSPYTISKYSDAGMPHKGKSGAAIRYDVTECIKWFVEWEVRKANPEPTEGAEDLDSQLTYWKVQRAKNLTLREQGTLVTVDDSVKELSHRLGQVRDVLLTIEFSWAPFLVGLTDTDAVQIVLRDKVDEMMTTLASLPESQEEAEAYETPESSDPQPVPAGVDEVDLDADND